MLTRTLRRSFAREEGQALVLACLTVLALSIAVITTVNLSHNVHEKIRLQNNADAAAYSMAAIEARAFNFYAFANRTQITHYVGAMVWQSFLSHWFFLEAFFTDAYGFMRTMNPCTKGGEGKVWKVICPALELIPYVGVVIKIINQLSGLFRTFVKGFQALMRATWPLDGFIGKTVIPMHRVLNAAMTAAQMAVFGAANLSLAQASAGVIKKNDPDVKPSWDAMGGGIVSACMFTRTHVKEAFPKVGKNSWDTLDPEVTAEDSKVARAKRTMGALTNASRYACDGNIVSLCRPDFVTHRKSDEFVALPPGLDQLADLILNAAPKYGQTRFLPTFKGKARDKIGRDLGRNGNGNLIRSNRTMTDYHPGPTASAEHLGSDDTYVMSVGPESVAGVKNPMHCDSDEDKDDKKINCWGDPDHKSFPADGRKAMMETSIWALNPTERDGSVRHGGIHWRLHSYYGPKVSGVPYRWYKPNAPTPEDQMSLNRARKCMIDVGVCLAKVNVFTANVRPMNDGNHQWGGVVPFMHFEPGHFAKECTTGGSAGLNAQTNQAAYREHEFNQPSTWAILNKSPAELRNPVGGDQGATYNTPSLLNDEGKLGFDFGQGTPQELDLDNRKKTFILFQGMNVISRGQAYYHRPGNWSEQPNFFNPYWRPRLASVYQGRYALPFMGDLVDALPGPLAKFPAKIITH